jgi:hypothetical protein
MVQISNPLPIPNASSHRSVGRRLLQERLDTDTDHLSIEPECHKSYYQAVYQLDQCWQAALL